MTALGAASRDTGVGALCGRDGRAWATRGANSRTAKLTQAQVDEMRGVPLDGPGAATHAALARRYGVSRDTVSRIRRGLLWT